MQCERCTISHKLANKRQEVMDGTVITPGDGCTGAKVPKSGISTCCSTGAIFVQRKKNLVPVSFTELIA